MFNKKNYKIPLDKFIDGVTQKTSGQYDTLSGIMGFSAGGKPIKIFKQRKKLDDRLINFLGDGFLFFLQRDS